MSLFDKAKEAITSHIPLNQIPEIKKVEELDEFNTTNPFIFIQSYPNNSTNIPRIEIVNPQGIIQTKSQNGIYLQGNFYSPRYNHVKKETTFEEQEHTERTITKEKINFSNGSMSKQWFMYKPIN